MKEKGVKIGMSVVGLLIAGFSVGLFKYSNFGTDPFQIFVEGIHSKTTLSYGLVYALINALVILFVFICNKRYIGIATVLNLFLIGYVVEFCQIILQLLIPSPDLVIRIVLLAIGFIFLCLGTALYITADLGVSPFSAISLIMADKKIAKFEYCRIFTDVACVVVGFFMHATIGIGTVISAFIMGPFIAFFRRTISDPLLLKLIK